MTGVSVTSQIAPIFGELLPGLALMSPSFEGIKLKGAPRKLLFRA